METSRFVLDEYACYTRESIGKGSRSRNSRFRAPTMEIFNFNPDLGSVLNASAAIRRLRRIRGVTFRVFRGVSKKPPQPGAIRVASRRLASSCVASRNLRSVAEIFEHRRLRNRKEWIPSRSPPGPRNLFARISPPHSIRVHF